MSKNNQIHWIVGNKRIDNQLEAYQLALRDTKVESRISFQEEEFDRVTWTQEPSKSWEELCLEHAIRIRQRWKKLKLFFSGGRESGHIFRVFEQAGIPIDELIIPYTPYSPLRVDEHFNHILPIAKQLCQRNPGMTIREVVQDKEWYEKIYKNSDWLTTKNKQFSLMFLPRKWDEQVKNDPDYESGNCGYIFGFEKPSIKLIDGVFYSQITNSQIQWAPDHTMPGVECFYWSTEIYVKQCWMLVNHFEKKYKKATSSFVDIFQRIKSPYYYDELVRVLGRGDPMSWALGNGQGRVLSNAHWSVQNLIKIAEEEKWKSFNEYKSILQDLHKNYDYLIDQNIDNTITLDKTINLDSLSGKKYLMKKQD